MILRWASDWRCVGAALTMPLHCPSRGRCVWLNWIGAALTTPPHCASDPRVRVCVSFFFFLFFPLLFSFRSLHLNCCNVTDASLQQLACAFTSHLRVMHIGYCGAVAGRGLAALVAH